MKHQTVKRPGKASIHYRERFACLSWQRRLRIRYEKRPNIYQACLTIECIKICWNRLTRLC